MAAAKFALSILFLHCGLTMALIGTKNTMDMLDFLDKNVDREGVVKRKSKLQYKVLQNGTGEFHPLKDSPCECHHRSTTLALTPDVMDKPEEEWDTVNSTYARGTPDIMIPMYEIKAIKEALQLMVEGDRWELYIHSELAYGDNGIERILGGDLLILRLELLRIKGLKTRAAVCDPKSREGCAPDEIELLESLGANPSTDSMKAMEASITKKLNGALKPVERIEVKAKLAILKKLRMARKREEL
mmetsp:Transcript_48944/g.85170  ORF Transcript_48944/g.85170 Transcript_48944/m.85170 type:complete len:244 (+) Transcript_48944:66-797(+)